MGAGATAMRERAVGAQARGVDVAANFVATDVPAQMMTIRRVACRGLARRLRALVYNSRF